MMTESIPAPQVSRTALAAAAARAAHRVVDDEPLILDDHLAEVFLTGEGREPLNFQLSLPAVPVLRAARVTATVRSRFAEDRLAASSAEQYVVLGAGLDTSGLRAAAPGGRTVHEVDLPQTQAWKRRALHDAGVAVPAALHQVPHDLRSDGLVEALAVHGLDVARPAFVSCLGTSMYLEAATIRCVLASLARLAPGSELVADYILDDDLREDAGRAYARAVGAAAGGSGEPWLSTSTPQAVEAALHAQGLTVMRHATERDGVDPALWRRTDALRPMALTALVHARVD